MELALNILWLALGAMAIWWSLRMSPRAGSSRFRSLVCAACLSVLIFPIVSVSDDLNVAPSDMEESTPRKPGFKTSAGSGSRIFRNGPPPPAEVVRVGFVGPVGELNEKILVCKQTSAGQRLLRISGSRAPPWLRSLPFPRAVNDGVIV